MSQYGEEIILQASADLFASDICAMSSSSSSRHHKKEMKGANKGKVKP
jgi:hypothetical protein